MKLKLQSPGVMIVVSNDFGELSSALYFLGQQPFDAVVAIPARLADANPQGVGVRAERYRTVDDIAAIARDVRPEVVLLFSGYLYGVNGLLDVTQVEWLIRDLRMAGAKVLTSDPFLGLMQGVDETTFLPRHPQRKLLMDHFARVGDALRDVGHVYPVDAVGVLASQVYGFYNRQALSLSAESGASRRERLALRHGVKAGDSIWLFILSAEDYAGGVGGLGRAGFDTLLRRKLVEAGRQGARAVLVAPPVCATGVGHGELAGALVLPFCPRELFESLLLEAEFVFYWNIISHSVLMRALHRLPVLFFSSGHLTTAVPAMLELAKRYYYAGDASIAYLDENSELTRGDVEKGVENSAAGMARTVAKISTLPGPVDVVMKVLAEGKA